jgi:pimeloyl-ACP methyl ester carboxylesterase
MKRVVSGFLSFLLSVLLISGCSSLKEGTYNFAISAERSISGMKAGSVSIGNQDIAYLERPGTGETVVLLHGFGANKDTWVRFVRYLPKEYRVFAFDLPGHGDSSRLSDQTYDIEFITQGMARTVDALGLSSFHLAGNSMGGYVTMMYCIKNPQRVISACLIDTAGIRSPQKSDLQISLEKGKNILVATTDKEFEDLLKYAFYSRPFIPWPVSSVLAQKAVEASPFNQKMWRDLAAQRDNFDFTPQLSMIRPPVLLIWGDRDRITHVSAAKVIERNIPRAETVIMKDCGHMPMLERPKDTATYYVAFLKSHGKNTE